MESRQLVWSYNATTAGSILSADRIKSTDNTDRAIINKCGRTRCDSIPTVSTTAAAAKKTKYPAKRKDKPSIGFPKSAADPRSKSERQKKKIPINLEPLPVEENSDQHDDREQWDIFQLDSSEPTRPLTLSSKIPKKTVEADAVGNKVPAPRLHSSDLGDSVL